MLCACIDIGTNTTRVLVADAGAGGLTEVFQERAFTQIGRALAHDGRLDPAAIAAVAEVVAAQRGRAQEHGAVAVRVVATAAIRGCANRDELAAAVRERAGLAVDVLDGEDEARLAFSGALATMRERPAGTIAVVDVGGGSSEIAVGDASAGVRWWTSIAVGSGSLGAAHAYADPPTEADIAALRALAAAPFADVDCPQPEVALAVGGSATSLRVLVGPRLTSETLERALAVLLGAPAAAVAAERGLHPERVRLLPAGILVLEAVARALDQPLWIGCGGLREGVVLALARGLSD